jgi:hypothetical protein
MCVVKKNQAGGSDGSKAGQAGTHIGFNFAAISKYSCLFYSFGRTSKIMDIIQFIKLMLIFPLSFL